MFRRAASAALSGIIGNAPWARAYHLLQEIEPLTADDGASDEVWLPGQEIRSVMAEAARRTSMEGVGTRCSVRSRIPSDLNPWDADAIGVDDGYGH